MSLTDGSVTSDEDVVAVAQGGVLWIRHGVEGADGQGVLVHHVEVRAVLLLNQLACIEKERGRERRVRDEERNEISQWCRGRRAERSLTQRFLVWGAYILVIGGIHTGGLREREERGRWRP